MKITSEDFTKLIDCVRITENGKRRKLTEIEKIQALNIAVYRDLIIFRGK